MRSSLNYLLFAALFILLLSASPEKRPFNESYRPQFHFSPEKNQMGGPNGLIYLDGEYHLFFQHKPNGPDEEVVTRGHVVSKDLVHWEHLPAAITPGENPQDSSCVAVLTGSAILDTKNLIGLQKGDQPTVISFYTSNKCGQRMAYSNDKGHTWQDYEGNPVIPYNELGDARDPKVFWHEPTKKYVMVLCRKPDGDEKKQGVSFYTSSNLVDWKYESHLPGFSDCPDLVELPVNRRPDDTRWVIFDGDGSYMIGQFDGARFDPESIKMRSDFGANYDATQTWNNIPQEDGRTIQIASLSNGQFPDMPFDGQLGVPCELSLKSYLDGIYLLRKPVSEIAILHEKGMVEENKNLIPGLNQNVVKRIKGDCLHIIGTFQLKTVNSFGFMVRHSKKQTGTEIRYDATKSIISCLGQAALLKPEDGKIKLEILVDRTSIEIFGNDGKMVMSNCFTPDPDADELVLYNTGGELLVEKLEIYPMKSMYVTE